MTTLILNTKTDRVIFFTDDPLYSPSNSDYTWKYNYNSELPNNLSLKNCWDWKLVNHRLVYSNTEIVTPVVKLMESNRIQCLKLLNEKIDKLTEKYVPQTKFEMFQYDRKIEFLNSELLYSRSITLEQSDFLNKHKQNLIILEDYELKYFTLKNKINAATILRDLELIRREIGNLE